MTQEYNAQVLMSGVLPDETLALLRQAPMPEYDGPEPSEIDITRIRKYIDERRFKDLPDKDIDWVCCRLMPSLMRYGTYPPPEGV